MSEDGAIRIVIDGEEMARRCVENIEAITGEKFALPGGATRSEEAPAYHMRPPDGSRRAALRWALGAKKHGAHNWRRSLDTREHAAGFCIEAYNHMQEHMLKLNSRADLEDDHLGAIAWGVDAIAECERLYGRNFWTEVPSA